MAELHDDRGFEHRLELPDAVFDIGLFLARFVILRVLGKVAKRLGVFEMLGYFLALYGLKVFELFCELIVFLLRKIFLRVGHTSADSL